ncbi:MAG: fumarate/nitrate reduction transcriptional regulator Fnr [Betaproteobacteria bacterium]|nr:fumarate/nitrate reduction transcriptional regulator Fnr [Betaproteobacteria bacterium]
MEQHLTLAAERHSAKPRVSTHCETLCQSCGLRELCLPAGLCSQDMEQLNNIIDRKPPLKHGDYLYRAGGSLQSLYAVRTGFLKSCVLHDDGREQVAGFHMMGELLGMDAIGSGKHISDAIALEDSEICEIPFRDFEHLSHELPTLQRHFHRVMSREIARDYGVMLLLGSMRAEERLAAFLLNLSQRFAARGYSATRFILRMTRQEIGSYLGLKLETVSRAFSHFQSEGIVAVQNKNIEIKEPERLRMLLGQCAGARQ